MLVAAEWCDYPVLPRVEKGHLILGCVRCRKMIYSYHIEDSDDRDRFKAQCDDYLYYLWRRHKCVKIDEQVTEVSVMDKLSPWFKLAMAILAVLVTAFEKPPSTKS